MDKPTIPFTEFEKIDLRIGKIIKAEPVTESKKLLRLEVDFKEDGKRIIFAGLAAFCNPDDIINCKFIFIINLEPKKILEEESQGMMLAVIDNSKPKLINIADDIKEGSVVK